MEKRNQINEREEILRLVFQPFHLSFFINLPKPLKGCSKTRKRERGAKENSFGRGKRKRRRHKSGGQDSRGIQNRRKDPPSPLLAGKGSQSGRLFSNNLLRGRGWAAPGGGGFPGRGGWYSRARQDWHYRGHKYWGEQRLWRHRRGPDIILYLQTNSPRADLLQERGEKIHLLPLPLGWKSNEVGFAQSSPRNLGELLFQNSHDIRPICFSFFFADL